jgi:uncharacterized membrane protein YhfC
MQISTATLVILALETLFGFLAPILAAVIWRRKSASRLKPLWVGALTFFVFAMVLEQIAHMVFLVVDWPVSRAIAANPYLYMLYGGLAAGIFEETGRYAAFSLVLKKQRSPQDAITYGIGHGGFECISILGMTMGSYLVLALLGYFAGGTGLYADDQIRTTMSAIAAISPLTGFFACVERVSAMALHVELSVLVFASVFLKRKRWLYPAAILLHAMLDFIAVLYQTGLISSLWVIEALIFLYVLVLFFPVRHVWRTLNAPQPNG